MELPVFINDLLAKDLPVVCYRLPDENEPFCLIGGSFRILNQAEVVLVKDGFIIAPFQLTGPEPIFFYEGRILFKGWDLIQSSASLTKKNEFFEINLTAPACIDFEEYKYQANYLVNKLKMGQLQKVVLSRVICQPLPKGFKAGDFFRALCLEYPSAFVYLFNDGNGRRWVGASPELLVRVENGWGETMSLAATLPFSKIEKSEAYWKTKEIEEQSMVSSYIRNRLAASGIKNFIEGKLETHQAGPVMHLLNRFRFKISGIDSVMNLAMALHPTPAVCGLPSNEALQEILDLESHQRAFYSGFLGPVSNKNITSLFVNLRCMQLMDENAFIFVGGGLLAESDIQREWQETALKAETLLSVIRKFK